MPLSLFLPECLKQNGIDYVIGKISINASKRFYIHIHISHTHTLVAESKEKNDLGSKDTYYPGVSKQKEHVGFEFKRINLQAAS